MSNHKFSHTIKRDHAAITIYDTPSHGYNAFFAVYYFSGKKQRKIFHG